MRRRRRRNRPGNAQANGPPWDDTLESGLRSRGAGPPTGVTAGFPLRKPRGKSLRSRDRGGAIASLRTRGALSNRVSIAPGRPDVRFESRTRRSRSHAAARAARGPWRAHGAVRWLRHAGAISARHPGRAQVDARERRPVRRLAHGAGDHRGPGRRGGARIAAARRHSSALRKTARATRSFSTRTAASSTT